MILEDQTFTNPGKKVNSSYQGFLGIPVIGIRNKFISFHNLKIYPRY